MNHPHEIRLDLDQGIDRKLLATLRGRFMHINQGRLLRATEGLSTRQQQVLTLLPLLLHVNHPLLPGYISGNTPAGVCGFEPSAAQVAEAQRLARSFSTKPRENSSPRPIQGLFLIGSLGSLAQAEQSDMDFWVCHAADLQPQALQALRCKCQLLEAWAASLGAEAHCFLIDTQAFAQGQRTGQLGSDDCGTTQHYLLLDEFYRTAIWLAGRIPVWWLVPVDQEGNYAGYTQALLGKRFIPDQETLDLGHLAQLPAQEFVGAGLWQLFKGIDSPHKSLLKLLLIEVYASEHATQPCLSLEYKAAVFANQTDLDALDPYVMMYRRIERYLLQRGQPARLELVRRSLYLKVNRKLSDKSRASGWQRRLMQRLTDEWGWGQRQLALLDSRPLWKVQQATLERRELVAELSGSYRFLSHFARVRDAASRADQRDLNVLGRRLRAAFERRAGKVEVINPGSVQDLAESLLTLAQEPDGKAPGSHRWALYRDNLSTYDMELASPLRHDRHLLPLLAWAHCNGVIDSSTRLAIQPGASDLAEPELSALLGCLRALISLPMPAASEVHLLQPSVADQILLLVNVGLDPLPHHRDLDITLTTERTDSLSYGGVRENLVLTVDQVTVNTWGEVLVARYEGEHALARCLRDYLARPTRANHRPGVRVHCFCQNRAQAIRQRIQEVFDTVQGLHQQGLPCRYLLQVAHYTHVLELLPGDASLTSLAGHDELLACLGQPRNRYSPLHLDPNALQGTDLALALKQGRPGCIQVFHRLLGGVVEVHVLDECNALWHHRLPVQDDAELPRELQRVLHPLLHGRSAVPDIHYVPL
ncbi:class I adenylate cyclase [Pseudomonas sp. NBRC 111119]|uniref:class I adenylate cyclase n=1 Tax=Pseudomonas sp. NBRC 111119 TaxID=1661034 RepID=UPI0009E95F9E|nr:class I adenylate cyclase [Pseudomonas sp. NBRC 111119]